jgi:hypothetical protein
MTINTTKNVAKIAKKYVCEKCDYNTSNNYDYNKHLSTDKHLRLTNTIEKSQEIAKIYKCECGKEYKHNSSLFNHRKKCNMTSVELTETKEEVVEKKVDYEKLISELIKTVNEQSKTISELIPKVGNTNISNNNNKNINIKIDNLTLLNDKCKDALSITDFIELIKIEVKDLLYTSEKGLTNGVSNLFIEQLNNLPLVKRPIWCSDKKRKKIFIKEEEWSEDLNNKKTKEAIKSISVKQAKNMNKYTKENPDWMKHERMKEKYIEIVKEATSELDEDKQTSVINMLLNDIHLSNEHKDEMQNNEMIN